MRAWWELNLDLLSDIVLRCVSMGGAKRFVRYLESVTTGKRFCVVGRFFRITPSSS